MRTSRIDKSFRWIIPKIFFVFYFLYFILFNRYHLIYQEQIQFFRFNLHYLTDFLSKPGGIIEYIGAFITQFYLFPFIAVSIVTLSAIAVYAITSYILRKQQIFGLLWSLVPVLFLASLQSYYTFKLAYTIGLIVSLGYFAIYITIQNNKLYYLFVFFGWPLLYFFVGGYAIFSIILCFFYELLFNRKHSRFLIIPMFPILVLLVPYLAAQLVFYIEVNKAWTFFLPLNIEVPIKLILIILFAYYLLILLGSKWWFTFSKSGCLSIGWTWKIIICGTLVIIFISTLIIKFVYNRKEEILLGIDNCVQRSNWDGILKLSSVYPDPNQLVMYFTNLALYKSGKMGDQLFNYPQAKTMGLWIGWIPDDVVPFFGGEIFYQLGYTSEAYRWAFEAMVAKGPNPRLLKRLAITSLINNDIKLAEKYLLVLHQSLFYRKWSQHYLNYVIHPQNITEDKELAEKIHFKIQTDFISTKYNFGAILPKLLEDHPDNQMVFEYYMASLILDKNLGDFAKNLYRLKEFGYESIPINYEEAILVYMNSTKKNIIPDGYAIRMTTQNRFSEYVKMYLSFGNNLEMANKVLYSKYGKTYWYYLHFIYKNIK